MRESEGTVERLSLNFSDSLFLFRIFKRCLKEDEDWPPVCKTGQPALRWVLLSRSSHPAMFPALC